MHSPQPQPNFPGITSSTVGCMGSWMVVLRRCSSDFNFHRTWNEYTQGFGTLPWDYYAGNSLVFSFTKNRLYYLRFDIYGYDGHFYSAEFEDFQLKDETQRFLLSIGRFRSGSAGKGSMSFSNQTRFTTFDNDNSGFDCSGKHERLMVDKVVLR